MYPVLFSIGSFRLYTYGLFIAIGLLSAMWISKRLARSIPISEAAVSDLYFVLLVCSLVGARALYVFISFDAYKSNLIEIFKIWNGGLVFFGGFCLSVVGALTYIRVKKLPLWKTADIIAPGIALGHALGRIGCLLAGCCHGRECTLPFAITFTHPESLAPLNVALHPTQIYSVISNLSIFFVLLFIYNNRRFDGMVFLIYLMLYSFMRSIVEFFRGDFRGDFFFDFISLSQGIGISISVIAVFLLIKLSRSAADDPD